jgi:hypothetical protein
MLRHIRDPEGSRMITPNVTCVTSRTVSRRKVYCESIERAAACTES